MVNHISKVGLSIEGILSSGSFKGINKQGIRFLEFEACDCEEMKRYKNKFQKSDLLQEQSQYDKTTF